ncbi:hypothetical protein ACWATR_07545 [Nostoc sp. UIC 10890]
MTNDFGGGRLSWTPHEGMGFPPIFDEWISGIIASQQIYISLTILKILR